MANYTGIRFSIDGELPRLTPVEIRHLRRVLGWSQARMGEFLDRDAAMVSRWESGRYEPEALVAGVLYRLWTEVLGDYQGPYEELGGMENTRVRSGMTETGANLLKLGVIGFIAFGLDYFTSDDE